MLRWLCLHSLPSGKIVRGIVLTIASFAFASLAWGCQKQSLNPSSVAPVVSTAAVQVATSTPAPQLGGGRSPEGNGLEAEKRQFQVVQTQVEFAVASAPKNYALRLQAAKFYMDAGNHKGAIPHLQAATRLQPQEIFPWAALGDAATLSDQYTLASAAYQRAESLSPGNALVAFGHGQLLVRQGRVAAAQRVLEAGRVRYPTDPEILFALGNLYRRIGQRKLAAGTLKQLLTSEPNRPDVLCLLALVQEENRQLKAATVSLQTAVQIAPQLHSAWAQQARCLLKLSRYTEAREAARNAIALSPRVASYHGLLGQSYLSDLTAPDALDQAVKAFREALTLDRNYQSAQQSLSLALSRRGTPTDLKEAILLLNRLAAKTPETTQTQYLLADVHRRLGNQQAASEHQARFQRLTSASQHKNQRRYRKDAFLDTAEAHLNRGRGELEAGHFQQAATEFRLALARQPDLLAAQQGLNRALARRSQLR